MAHKTLNYIHLIRAIAHSSIGVFTSPICLKKSSEASSSLDIDSCWSTGASLTAEAADSSREIIAVC